MLIPKHDTGSIDIHAKGIRFMEAPQPTPVFRLIHIDNLPICLQRGALHASNYTPNDGIAYKTIHNEDIQRQRNKTRIPCGPDGVIHDYVAFYFGYLSPMLFQLKTGRVQGYSEGQEPLIYLVSSAQVIEAAGKAFVFSDGQGIAFNTNWYCSLTDLNKVDWEMVYQRYWSANYESDIDRQRRKQAEFLVHRVCEWPLIQEIGVINGKMKDNVEKMIEKLPGHDHCKVAVRAQWYY